MENIKLAWAYGPVGKFSLFWVLWCVAFTVYDAVIWARTGNVIVGLCIPIMAGLTAFNMVMVGRWADLERDQRDFEKKWGYRW